MEQLKLKKKFSHLTSTIINSINICMYCKHFCIFLFDKVLKIGYFNRSSMLMKFKTTAIVTQLNFGCVAHYIVREKFRV